MLTLAKVVSAESAASYYEGSDDYYSEDGRAPSAWWGAGADALGLRGEVDSGDFRILLEGQLPDGTQMHRGGEGRTAGLDLTFSAPKSLSMQALIGGSTELLDAHQQAVGHALRYVQAELAAYRNTQDGETVSVRSQNVVAARFDHDLSRELDPQVHTHCVLLNLTQRADGEWRALDAHALYEQQKLLGVIYRAELAKRVQDLGYGIRRTHQDGRFELAHITRQQVEAFSTRIRALVSVLSTSGELDPVTVWWDGKAWACVDGHHRLAAYAKAGKAQFDISVRVFEGSLEDALVLAARTNTKDKLPMSRAEKSNAAWRLVLTTPASKATLAEAAGVSESIVAHMRRVLNALKATGRHSVAELLDMTWDTARRLSVGQQAPDWDPEEEERRVQAFATKLHKVFGVQGAKQPDIFLRAVELYSPKLYETMETMLRERLQDEPEEASE